MPQLLELQQSSYLVSSIDLLAQVLILLSFNSYIDEAMFTLTSNFIKVLKNVKRSLLIIIVCADLKGFLNDVKPQLQTLIDAEIEKNPYEVLFSLFL